jgi:nicotinic acid mononucleotide adenylyltransferase
MLERYCRILNRLFSEGGTAAYFDMPSVEIPAGLPVTFTVDKVSIDLKTGVFIEMLEVLKAAYPDRRIAMLLGHDNMLALKSWRRMDRVADMVDTFVVVKRGDVNASVEEYAAMFPEGTDKGISQKLLVVPAPPDYSSSKIRAMWAAGDEEGVALTAGRELADYMRTQGIGSRTKNTVKAMFSKGGAIKNRFMKLLARPFRPKRKTARKSGRRSATRKQRR